MFPGKLFYAFEHDVFPLCHCKLKESHRDKLGGFGQHTVSWRTFAGFHRRLLAEAEPATSKAEICHSTPDWKIASNRHP
jgi:hypothetical protein